MRSTAPVPAVLVLALAAGAGCSGGEDRLPAETLPASFTGDLPCADCEAIHHHLDLFPDGTYVLRLAYRGRPGDPVDTVGLWEVPHRGTTLVLYRGEAAPLRFTVVSADSLRLLSRDGSPIVSALNYTLARVSAFSPVEPRLELHGMYCYLADAALFTECTTGWSLPVAMEEDNRALERAYIEASSEPGEEMLVTLRGRIVRRMPMEGPGPVPTLVPERFIAVRPGGACP